MYNLGTFLLITIRAPSFDKIIWIHTNQPIYLHLHEAQNVVPLRVYIVNCPVENEN